MLITFTGLALEPFAERLVAVPGLVASTLIDDGVTSGAFQVFADAAAADRYLTSDAFAAVRHDTEGTAFELRRFDVLR